VKKRILFLLFGLSLGIGTAWAEDIQGPVAAEIALKTDTDYEISQNIAGLEYISLYLEASNRFLNAIQIEVTLSNDLKEYADRCMFVMYKQAKKILKNDTVIYQCTPLMSTALPYKNKVYFQIPLSGKRPSGTDDTNASFFTTEPVSFYDFPILVGIITKDAGAAEHIRNQHFYLAIKPVIASRGILQLAVNTPQNQVFAYEVMIDGNSIRNHHEEIILDSGIHTIRISSNACKEINGTFAILSGKTTRLEFALEFKTTYIIIDAPKDAVFFLDGERVWYTRDRKIAIKEGEHTIDIKIDTLSISKKFVAESGKIYTISLLFNIIIKEN
jgi:hypothetical protein